MMRIAGAANRAPAPLRRCCRSPKGRKKSLARLGRCYLFWSYLRRNRVRLSAEPASRHCARISTPVLTAKMMATNEIIRSLIAFKSTEVHFSSPISFCQGMRRYSRPSGAVSRRTAALTEKAAACAIGA